MIDAGIQEGDYVIVRQQDAADPGDIVVALLGSQLVSHRLVDISNGMAITKGDASGRLDPPVPLTALLGRVVEVQRKRQSRGRRYVGRLIHWVRRRI